MLAQTPYICETDPTDKTGKKISHLCAVGEILRPLNEKVAMAIFTYVMDFQVLGKFMR